MIGGGKDRQDLKNFNPRAHEASGDPRKLVGYHKGKFAALNLDDPVPGRHHVWQRTDQSSQIIARLRGYTPVDGNSQTKAGHSMDPAFDHQAIDSSQAGFPGIVLMSRSEEDERRERDEQATKRSRLMRSGDERYLRGASGAEISAGGQRLQRDDHRSYMADGADDGAQVISTWKPESR